MLNDQLCAYIFDGRPNALALPLAEWLESSRRFAAFVTTFRDKIRKKLRLARDQEALLDLRLELETAYRLLGERPLSLVYEPLQPGQSRCPDFAVSYTTSLTFMVEVTRLRTDQRGQAALDSPDSPGSPPASADRLADTICGKLGQLLPQRSNVLVVAMEAPGLAQEELRALMIGTQQRAERSDPAFLRRHRVRDRSEFFQRYQRLSEILLRGPELHADAPIVVWVNPQARHPLPSKARTALYQSHAG